MNSGITNKLIAIILGLLTLINTLAILFCLLFGFEIIGMTAVFNSYPFFRGISVASIFIIYALISIAMTFYAWRYFKHQKAPNALGCAAIPTIIFIFYLVTLK